ncbi:TetR family transcriptional regulator [Streptomyces tauricus]|uniref:TetR family transcriptional regulator n=2 Tax=Streptomyces tauricus TaxID=68274 RepID=A0ABZ1JEJ3_9ACTN|nr:TetR family transcriptional regulator [Streptomyces tauricus]MCW8095526.1 TetR family transcriptional regulator [Streptomyces tauricus]
MTPMTAARTPLPATRPQLGLRERKKIKTRTAIRDATYRLIEEQGFDATTIEQIAELAEVSPSTVFRYFPTKEDIVLTDEFAPFMAAELRARPADEPWLDSLRHVFRKAVDFGTSEEPAVTRLRTRLMVEVPSVRSRMMESMSVTGDLLRQVIGERTGRAPDSFEVRVFAMSVVGCLMEVTLYWAEHRHVDDLGALVERALDVMRHGLPPGKP